MTVGPSTRRQTHHLSLTDGSNTLNLLLCNRRGEPDPKGWQRANSPKTSLRVVQGNEGYGDFELPFSTMVQSDFSGGRGSRDFEADATRYADGYRCDTNRPNEARIGPKATQGSGYNITYTSSTGTTATSASIVDMALIQFAASFVPGAFVCRGVQLSFTLGGLYLVNGPDATFTMKIYSHHSGDNRPDAVVASANTIITCTSDGVNYVYSGIVSFDISYTFLGSSTKYWVSLESSKPIATLSYNRGVSSGNKIMKYTGIAWADVHTDATMAFSMQALGYGRSILFEYRGRKMAVTQSDDQTAPKLWMQGYHGLASSNSADKSKLNTSLNLTGVDLSGKYARIISGPGSAEETPWRKISSNTATGTNDVITVAPAWNITHTTSTEFVIQGCTNWQEIASTSGSGTSMTIQSLSSVLTVPVTDVLVVDDIIYFAQGEDTGKYIARTRFNNGAWAQATSDGLNQATYLELVQDSDGTRRVWRAMRGAATVAESNKVSWGTQLGFAADLVCGDTSSQITGLLAAKLAGPMLPVVFKETEFGAVSGITNTKIYDTFHQYPEARDDFNGRAALQPDLYMWFSLMDGVERYYDQRLDDVGPNRDEGMPLTRKGRVSAMVRYFSQIYIAYDAGRYGYSSILRYNGTGWCEVYRGGYGKRIRSMLVDVLPDLDNADRLWFSEEEDIYYIPVSLNPDKTDGYAYMTGTYSSATVNTGAQLETAWIYGPYKDITKYWDSLAIFTRNATSNIYIAADYKVDSDANAWTAIDVYNSSPVEEHDISAARNVTGKCIKFRLTFVTNNEAISPVVTAIRVSAVVRVKPKAVWNVTCLASDGKTADLQGVLSDGDVDTVVDRLEAWQDGTSYPSPLTASFFHTLNNGKRGFVDGVSSAPIEVTIQPGVSKMVTLISFQFIEV